MSDSITHDLTVLLTGIVIGAVIGALVYRAVLREHAAMLGRKPRDSQTAFVVTRDDAPATPDEPTIPRVNLGMRKARQYQFVAPNISHRVPKWKVERFMRCQTPTRREWVALGGGADGYSEILSVARDLGWVETARGRAVKWATGWERPDRRERRVRVWV